MKTCSVDSCGRAATASGFCLMHYKRWKRHGDPTKTSKVYRHASKICSQDGCLLPTWAKDLCQNHYALMRRNGAPVIVRKFVGAYLKDGYRYVMVATRHYEPEHRVLMERALGRKLETHEHVHHKDGDTLNNDLSNLQLVSASDHLKIHIVNRMRGYHGRYVST